jgi:hypothetical protein
MRAALILATLRGQSEIAMDWIGQRHGRIVSNKCRRDLG